MRNKHPQGVMMLLTVIIVGAVGLVVSAYLLFSSVSTGKSSLNIQQSEQAKAAANACAELALGLLQTNINLVSPVINNFTINAANKTTCTYTITGVSPNYSIASSGIADAAGANVTRKVNITLNQVGPVLNIASWQEQ